VATITDVRYWKCPKCGELLEKGLLESGMVNPGESADRIFGTGTCSGCGTGYPQSAIYGGEYDFLGARPTEEAPEDRVPTVVSVVLFREGREPPSSDPQAYCATVLREHYGRDVIIDGWQLVGRLDRPTAGDIGALYSGHVSKGSIPDYGTPTDQLERDGPDGQHVAALVFWKESMRRADAPRPKKKRFWQR
jgi:hypothetical protein